MQLLDIWFLLNDVCIFSFIKDSMENSAVNQNTKTSKFGCVLRMFFYNLILVVLCMKTVLTGIKSTLTTCI